MDDEDNKFPHNTNLADLYAIILAILLEFRLQSRFLYYVKSRKCIYPDNCYCRAIVYSLGISKTL